MSCDPAPHELRQIGEALAAREIPADELAEAEHAFRIAVPDSFGVDAVPDWAVQLYMAEYDVRGRERDAARAEVERLREELAQADEFGRGEFRVTQWAYDQAVRTIDELRARDDAAKALAREVGRLLPRLHREDRERVRGPLDALARAHEARDGGRDR